MVPFGQSLTRIPMLQNKSAGWVAITMFGLAWSLSGCAEVSIPTPRGGAMVMGSIARVADGDTLTLRTAEGRLLPLRLWGVDAPELPHWGCPGQPFGRQARDYVLTLTKGQEVQVFLTGRKTYERYEARVQVHGQDLGHLLARAGFAERVKGYRDPGGDMAQDYAQATLQGIWTLGAAYESPAVYRKRCRTQ